MTPEFRKWLLRGVGGVMLSLVTAGLIWFIPYQIDHHKKTNDAVIKVEQLGSDFYEYRVYQEYQDLKHAESKRELSEYEKDRLRFLEQELEQIRRRRYSPRT